MTNEITVSLSDVKQALQWIQNVQCSYNLHNKTKMEFQMRKITMSVKTNISWMKFLVDTFDTTEWLRIETLPFEKIWWNEPQVNRLC